MAERIVRVMSRTRKVHLAHEGSMTLLCGSFFKRVMVSPDDEPVTCLLCVEVVGTQMVTERDAALLERALAPLVDAGKRMAIALAHVQQGHRIKSEDAFELTQAWDAALEKARGRHG